MKSVFKALAVVAAAIGVVGLAGCTQKNNNAYVGTSANWNVRVSTSVENDSKSFWLANKEVATYSVQFKEGANGSYTVSYDDGAVYSTEFYMENYNWRAAGIPEGYADEAVSSETVYVFKTTLTIGGEYKLAGADDGLKFNDSVVTVSKFRLAKDNLQPVYSHQTVKSTAPNTISAPSIELACVEVDGVYETYYDYACTKADVTETDNNEKDGKVSHSEVALGSGGVNYSVFDNSQLRAAIRAFTLTGGATRTFNVLTPQNACVQTCRANISEAVALDREGDEQIIRALANAPKSYIFFDGTPSSAEELAKTVRYSGVSLSINSSMPGPSVTQWYATVENAGLNFSRSVLLKVATPLSFNMGTLIYSLSSLTVQPV